MSDGRIPDALKLPPLPRQVSSNGAEIWDWGRALGDAIHRRTKAAELGRDIATFHCGDCDHWMKRSECPREHNVDGRNRGPSMNGTICGQFAETTVSVSRREKRRGELHDLLAGEAA